MHETPIQLRHLDKLKGQAPRPFLRYAEISLPDTIPNLPIVQSKTERGPLLLLLPPFFLVLLLGILFIWLLPLDQIYHIVFTLLCVLFGVAGVSTLEMQVKRWSTPKILMTQRVPAIKGDPLRVLAQDLGEDTNVYLERITR